MYMLIGNAPSQLSPILIQNVPITLVIKIKLMNPSNEWNPSSPSLKCLLFADDITFYCPCKDPLNFKGSLQGK